MKEEQQKIKQYKFSFRTDKVTYDRIKKLSEINNETDSKTINKMVKNRLENSEKNAIIMRNFIANFAEIEGVCKALGHSHSSLNQLAKIFNHLKKQDVIDYEKLVELSEKISRQLTEIQEKQYKVEVVLNRISALRNEV